MEKIKNGPNHQPVVGLRWYLQSLECFPLKILTQLQLDPWTPGSPHEDSHRELGQLSIVAFLSARAKGKFGSIKKAPKFAKASEVL